jgi:hypothetical protein
MIGYSTGSLDWRNARRALELLGPDRRNVVELSALRTHELMPLLRGISALPLQGCSYVAVHAPSSFTPAEERDVVSALLKEVRGEWRIVLHPDTIHDHRLWAQFGAQLCIENMDRRKPGRTVEELQQVFDRLPDASFCFDVAHARQCDTSMVEAYRLLHAFGDRLAQVHVSELDAQNRHVRLTHAGIWACRQIANLIPIEVPAIIEAPVLPDEIDAELDASLDALGRLPRFARAA